MISSLASRPVSVLTTASDGAVNRTDAATRANASNIGSISGEWNACETASRFVRTPRAAKGAAIAATASAAPATTTCAGPFTAAIATGALAARTASATSVSAAAIDTIAPPAGSACISRPRAATSRTAPSSEKTPATHAAVSSPMLCPATTSGRTPHARHSASSAYSTVKSAGCVYAVWSSSVAASLSGAAHTTSRSGRSSSASNSAAHRSHAARNAGHASYSPRPIPSRCAPWPANRNATFPRALRTCPRATPAGVSPRAAAASARRTSSRDVAATASRCSIALRVVAALNATSPTLSSACASMCAASRPACALSAASVFPDSTTSSAGRAGVSAPCATIGASSNTTCALVPLNPNELTPATRGRAPRGHATASAATRTGSSDHGTCWLGASKWRFFGICSCSSARTTFIIPATPAAACVWPMLLLTEPMITGSSSGRSDSAAPNA